MCKVASFALAVCGVDVGVAVFDVLVRGPRIGIGAGAGGGARICTERLERARGSDKGRGNGEGPRDNREEEGQLSPC